MNAANLYRAQQLAISAAIDSGDYEKACDLARQDIRTFAEPERSTETGDKRTLTRRRKYSIIKAIRRCVRRKRKIKEEKKMNIYEYTISWACKNGTQIAHAYCIAGSKNEAKRKISERVPYKIDAIKPDDLGTVQSVKMLPEKSAEIGDRVKLWYFDANNKEHAEFF